MMMECKNQDRLYCCGHVVKQWSDRHRSHTKYVCCFCGQTWTLTFERDSGKEYFTDRREHGKHLPQAEVTW